jgi:hypothetical protein
LLSVGTAIFKAASVEISGRISGAAGADRYSIS